MVERQLIQTLSDRAQLADWIREAGLEHGIETTLAELDRLCGHYEFATTEERKVC
jgi:hypothetical protein